jgi:hypothetical protein
LLLIAYFALRVANQEFAPWRFRSIRNWIGEQGQSVSTIAQGQFAFLALHIGFSIFLCTPLLIWAAAIARTPADRLAGTMLLLFFYALSYSVWGLLTLVLWERRAETRQVFIRCFFFVLVIVSALFYLPLNPVAFLLAYLGRQELSALTLLGRNWSATTVHFAFHIALGGLGFAFYALALKRQVAV